MFLSVRRTNDYSEIKVRILKDLEQNKGPLMGIYSVMCGKIMKDMGDFLRYAFYRLASGRRISGLF